MSSTPSIGIGICTKNRWEELATTLQIVADAGLSQYETIVIDDASDSPVPPETVKRFPWVRFMRSEQGLGLIRQRNRLAELLSTDYYLCIDDDSFPVAGSIEDAARWMDEHPDVSALAFRIIFAGDDIPEPMTEANGVWQIKDYIGCGHMVRRKTFVELGGYEGRFFMYHEEVDYNMRTFHAGFKTYCYLPVVIRHVTSPKSRYLAERARLFTRNLVLIDLWLFPFPMNYGRALGHPPLMFKRLPGIRPLAWAMIRGWVEGFWCYLTWANNKPRLNWEQTKQWNSMHGAVRFMSHEGSFQRKQ